MCYPSAVKKLAAAGFTREQAFALADCIYECVGVKTPDDQGTDGDVVNPPQSEVQTGIVLPQHQLFGGLGASLISGLTSIKAIMAWSAFVQVMMVCLAYYLRGYIRTGFDLLILIGLYGNAFAGGIAFLIFFSRGKRSAPNK